jgi:hypothetical protein
MTPAQTAQSVKEMDPKEMEEAPSLPIAVAVLV